MWEIVRAGGPFMWPIVLCSVVAAAIILERLWTLQEQRVLPRDLIRRVRQLVEADQVNEKVIAALEQNSPLGRVLAAGLASRHRSREIMMERLEDAGRHVVHDLERFLNTLGTIASTSPLLGLLGTVTGIIKSFNALQAGAAGDPRMLSGGIAEALIATAAGLCVAIPALIAYRYLRGRVESFVVEMEKDAIRLADVVEGAGRERGGQDRPAHERAAIGPARMAPRPDPSRPPVRVPGESASTSSRGPGDQPGLPDRRGPDDGGVLHALQLPGGRGAHPRAPAAGPGRARRQAAGGAAGGVGHAAGRLPGQRPRTHQFQPGYAARGAAEGSRHRSHACGSRCARMRAPPISP